MIKLTHLKTNKLMTNKEHFKEYYKDKFPELDTDRIISIFENKLSSIEIKSNNEELRLPLSCDLNKAMILSVINEYINPTKL